MGGFVQPGTTIHGVVASPGIPFFDSPTGGFYETADTGLGIALAGSTYFKLTNKFFNVSKATPPTGILSAIAGSPFVTQGVGSRLPSISPDGLHVFVPNYNSAAVTVYARNLTTDVLTPIVGSPFAVGVLPYQAVVSPNGNFVYVTNNGELSVTAFTRNQITGFLTPVAGSPFAAPGGNTTWAAITPDGNYLLVAGGLGSVLVFSINQITGVIAQVAGSPFNTGSLQASQGLSISPSGDFVYVAHIDNTVRSFSINKATGALLQLSGSPTTIAGALSCVISPDNLFLYVATSVGGGAVFICNVDQLTGNLSNPTNIGIGVPNCIQPAISSDGAFIYFTASTLNQIRAFSRNLITGGLSEVVGSPFATGTTPYAACISANNATVYVANSGTNNVSAFSTSVLANGQHLIDCTFDPTLSNKGSVNINGQFFILGNAVLSQSGADTRYAQLTGQYVGLAGGTANALTLAPVTALTSYASVIGETLLFLASANNTTAITIAISGLAPLTVTKGGVALPIGGLIAGNLYYAFIESATSIRVAPFDATSINGDTMIGALKILGANSYLDAGGGLRVPEVANSKQGITALVAGTVTVANTGITAVSRIIFSPYEGGLLTGIVRVSARVVGTSFTLTSTVVTDTANIAYEIFEPG